MKKLNKGAKILKYANSNPEATIKEVATKVGTTYGYAYKIIKGMSKKEVSPLDAKPAPFGPGSFIYSDGSTADYYVLPKEARELQDLISHKNMNAQIGEIFRACYRYGEVSHSDMLRDAKKIKFYAEAEIKRLGKLNESKN